MILETEWFTASDLAGLGLPDIPTTERGVTLMAQRRDWRAERNVRGEPLARRRQGRGGGWEYHYTVLPQRAQVALVRQAAAEKKVSEAAAEKPKETGREELWDWYARLPDSRKAVAQQRLTMVQAVKALRRGGVRMNDAVHTVARQNGVGPSTLYSWLDRLSGHDKSDWLPALAPRQVGKTATAACDPQAWEVLKADYLRLSRPSFESCYERLQAAAAERGWTLPSSRTLRRRLEREIPAGLIVLAREGTDAVKRLYPPQYRDRSMFHALEAVNADGHKADVFVQWPGEAQPVRPIILAIQDLYSGKILAWRVGLTESAHLVQLSFGDLFQAFGVPDHAYLDNGRGFASKWITGQQATRFRFKAKPGDPCGLLTQLGVQVHWTTPYSGQSKPIERAFRDLCDSLWRHPAFEGAYAGNGVDAKPENYRSRAVSKERFLEVLSAGIQAHNARSGRRTQVCGGTLSFDDAFERSWAESPVRRATSEQLRFCLMAAEQVRARQPGGHIELFGNRYWEEWSPGLAGQPLTIRFDPDDLVGGVEVFRIDGAYVGRMQCWEAAGFADAEAARSHSRARAAYLKAQKALLDAERTMTAEQVAALFPESAPSAPPPPKVVRMVNGGTAAAPAADPEAMTAEEMERAFSAGLRLIEGGRDEV